MQLQLLTEPLGNVTVFEISEPSAQGGNMTIRALVESIVRHQIAAAAGSDVPSEPAPLSIAALTDGVRQGEIRPLPRQNRSRKVDVVRLISAAFTALQDGYAIITVAGDELEVQDLDAMISLSQNDVISVTKLVGLSGDSWS